MVACRVVDVQTKSITADNGIVSLDSFRARKVALQRIAA
jgi:hypothetical protein